MIKKIMILFCIFIFLIIGISGTDFNPEIIGEFTEDGVELIGSDTLKFGEGEYDIGNLIGEEIEVIASKVWVEKKEESNKIIFQEEGYVNVNGNLFKNAKKLSSIEVDSEGNVKGAYLTATKDNTVFFLEGREHQISAGQTIILKNGKITLEGGDSLRIKDESSEKFIDVGFLGESLEIEKNLEGNSVFTGDFTIGNDEARGTATVYAGKIYEIGKNTEATIKGINNKVFENNLKVSYDNDFDLSNCKENCINYGNDKISLIGSGFTTNLGEKNDIFGDMQNEKYVHLIGTKERNLEIELNGGSLEIKKDLSNSNLGFDIKHEGDFVIDNGRAVIYSEKDIKLEEQRLFVKARYDEELTYSYDLNFNEGEYILENNIFKDNKGNELFNGNLPWENVVYNADKISETEARNIKKRLQAEGRLIYEGDPFFLDWIKGECGEAIIKEIYLAQETANQNKDGIKGSPLDLYGLLKAEGAGFQGVDEYGYQSIPFFEMFCDTPQRKIVGTAGLTLVGSKKNVEILKDGNYIPKNLQVESITGSGYYMPKQSTKNVFVYAAGVFNNQEKKLRDSIIKLYGEEELNKMSKDEFAYWKTISYWGPFTYERYLEDREDMYIKTWGDRPIPSKKDTKKLADNLEYIKWLARLRTDFEHYLGPEGLNLFAYPS